MTIKIPPNYPRFHFDPLRQGCVIPTRPSVVAWCMTCFIGPDGARTRELITMTATRTIEEKTVKSVAEFIQLPMKSISQTVDYIYDLAVEFGFDPLADEECRKHMPRVLNGKIVLAVSEMTDIGHLKRDLELKLKQIVDLIRESCELRAFNSLITRMNENGHIDHSIINIAKDDVTPKVVEIVEHILSNSTLN